jgi:hypothetical protein
MGKVTKFAKKPLPVFGTNIEVCKHDTSSIDQFILTRLPPAGPDRFGDLAVNLTIGRHRKGLPNALTWINHARRAFSPIWGMLDEKRGQSKREPKPSRLAEMQRNLEDYANDLRAIIEKLRRKLDRAE